MVRYYQLIESLDIDIAVAPLEDNMFNHGKSNVKLLEYGMLGLPIIASPVGPYLKYANEQSIDIATADGSKFWEYRMSDMVQGYNVIAAGALPRKTMAERNRENVRKHHLISARADAWEAALCR